jgi:hypothetical protein
MDIELIDENKIKLDIKTKDEKWTDFIRKIQKQWKDGVRPNFSISHIPRNQDLEELLKVAMGRYSRRLFWYCCTKFGFNKFYADARNPIDIFKFCRIAQEIRMLFSAPELRNYPKIHLKLSIRDEIDYRDNVSVEISEEQKGMLIDYSFDFGITEQEFQLMLTIYCLNSIFDSKILEKRYDPFTYGLLRELRESIKDFGNKIVEYLNFACYHIEREIKLETFAVEQLNEPDNRLIAKKELFKKVEKLLEEFNKEQEAKKNK